MPPFPSKEVFDRVEAATGRPLLEYVLNATLEAATAADGLTPEQFGIVSEIDKLLAGPLVEQFEPESLHEFVRLWLTEPGEGGQPLANRLYVSSGGTLPELIGDESAEALLHVLARDTYPAFLLPPDLPIPAIFGERPSRHVTSVLLRHPDAKAFRAAILADPLFAPIFSESNPHTGRTAMIYRSTFRGGGLQLVMLAETLLVDAWRHTSGRDQPPTVPDFCRLAGDRLSFMRSALSGKPLTIKARQAFTGIRLPPDIVWSAGKGLLVREATDQDRKIAPESLKQQLSSTDQRGVTTVVNYDGDVVVEYDYPYRVKALKDSVDDLGSIMDELGSAQQVEQVMTRLRISLLIGVRRPDYKVQILPTWQYFDDPFDIGLSLSWSDPRQSPGLMATQLTADDLKAWQEWFALLGASHVDRISVALSRVVRAVAERREPSDVLIDSVIAWENLFGTREGEPTLRVTASLALLLDSDPNARRERRRTLRDIYHLRSNVVHGNRPLGRNDYPLCYKALDVAIEALRVLLRDRNDVLALPTGDERSLHLILGHCPKDKAVT